MTTAAVGLAITVTGSDGPGWSWTGFTGHQRWDWIAVRVVPALVPIGFNWFSVQLAGRETAAAWVAPAAGQPQTGPLT